MESILEIGIGFVESIESNVLDATDGNEGGASKMETKSMI